MNALDIIRKKRDRVELNQKEVNFFIDAICKKEIPDYQITSWLMACTLNGMTPEETFFLTAAMKESGETLTWRAWSKNLESHKFADKHSTGGIGDKVSIVLAPLAACVGLTIPMMSGRGLGHTGGTVDKLESIAGFNLYLSQEKMLHCLEDNQVLMMAQSQTICPADRILYSLRDVSATAESLELITASIVSKKWAEGIDSILYDVKYGSAAFMPTLENARELAASLLSSSMKAGLKASAALSRMEEPLGWAIGNALEVEECYEILTGHYKNDRRKQLSAPLRELCIELVAKMAMDHSLFPSYQTALEKTQYALESEQALARFDKMLSNQGAAVDWNEQLPVASKKLNIYANNSGYIKTIHAKQFGYCGRKIKMGRFQVEDQLDYSSGYELYVQPGDEIRKGDLLLSIKHNQSESMDDLSEELLNCFDVSKEKCPAPDKLLLEFV